MSITISEVQGSVAVTVLQPHGELDASNYRDLIDTAAKAYDRGARDMLLDLGDVAYMSSSGLVALQSIGAMLRGETPVDPEEGWGAYRAIDRERDAGFQQHFKLLNPQPRVEQVIKMTGFDRFLAVFTDLEAAAASF